MRLVGGRELLEQRGGALFERGLLLVVDRLGGLERLARLEVALGFDRRFGLRLRFRGGDLGRGTAATPGPLLPRRRPRPRRRPGRAPRPWGGRGAPLPVPFPAPLPAP